MQVQQGLFSFSYFQAWFDSFPLYITTYSFTSALLIALIPCLPPYIPACSVFILLSLSNMYPNILFFPLSQFLTKLHIYFSLLINKWLKKWQRGAKNEGTIPWDAGGIPGHIETARRRKVEKGVRRRMEELCRGRGIKKGKRMEWFWLKGAKNPSTHFLLLGGAGVPGHHRVDVAKPPPPPGHTRKYTHTSMAMGYVGTKGHFLISQTTIVL